MPSRSPSCASGSLTAPPRRSWPASSALAARPSTSTSALAQEPSRGADAGVTRAGRRKGFLRAVQHRRYGRYTGEPDPTQLERYFHPDATDRHLVLSLTRVSFFSLKPVQARVEGAEPANVTARPLRGRYGPAFGRLSLLQAAPRIVRGRSSPGKGAQDPSSGAPREASWACSLARRAAATPPGGFAAEG